MLEDLVASLVHGVDGVDGVSCVGAESLEDGNSKKLESRETRSKYTTQTKKMQENQPTVLPGLSRGPLRLLGLGVHDGLRVFGSIGRAVRLFSGKLTREDGMGWMH